MNSFQMRLIRIYLVLQFKNKTHTHEKNYYPH
jgi:hypothetical protein